MKEINLPGSYNYIGAFLTMRCNMKCSYCINNYGDVTKTPEMDTDSWIEAFRRIPTRIDLPISIQGGEPTMHSGFYKIVSQSYGDNVYMDLLTNGTFDIRTFCDRVNTGVFHRQAKYASIRFSLHDTTDLHALGIKVYTMQNSGYEVGVWGIESPKYASGLRIKEAKNYFRWLNIDFRTKEFLGKTWSGGLMYGTYKYPEAVTGTRRTEPVWCKSSELLINPAGYIFRCHSHLYAGTDQIGHILDKDLEIKAEFKQCSNYGLCNPCDIKLKTNRFQEDGHCSVEIKGKGVK